MKAYSSHQATVAIETAADQQKRRFEPWPVVIVLFFLVVFFANALLVYKATSSWNGLVTDKYYKEGLAYNDVIRDQDAQNALGWTLSLTHDLRADQVGRVRLVLNDRQGGPVTGAEGRARFFRPTTEGYDQNIILKESKPGVYVGSLRISLPGSWDLKAFFRLGKDQFRYAERLHVSGPVI